TVRLRAVWARTGLSSDGKTIITVTRGRLVKFWDADTGKLREKRELPIQLSDAAFLSSDGRLLAVQELGLDSPITIWDLAANKRRHPLRLPKRTGIYRALFSPDGKTLAVSGSSAPQKPVVHLWDLASEKHREFKGHVSTPESLAFSPDGKFLAASDDSRVICWDVARGEKLWQRKCYFGVKLAFTSDGRTLIGSPGHRERAWHTWNVATGTPAPGLKLPEGYKYAQLAVAPDNRTLVFVQGWNVQGADGLVRLWDLRNGKLLHTLNSQGDIGSFFPDGKSFLSNDGALQRWELATGRPLLPDTEKMGHHAEVSRAIYSADGRRLASTASHGTIRLWDIVTAKPLHILRGHEATALAFTPDGKLLISGGNEGELYVWDTNSGNLLRRIPLHDPKGKEKQQNLWQLHLTPDGRTLIVLGYNPDDPRVVGGILSRFDLASGQRKGRIDIGPCDGFYAGFSPDGGALASRGELRDTTNGKARVKLTGGLGYLPHYAFSPDGRQVAGHLTRTVQEPMRTTTKMEGIQIWDAATGQARRLLPTDWVGQLAFSPDGHYLAAADLQGLRLWELASGKVVLRHKAHERMRGSYGDSFASCLSFAPDGRTLATGHLDSTILVWKLVPSGRPATAKDLPRLWKDFIGTDAARAYAASWQMADIPKEAIHFLQAHLRPVAPASAEQVRSLLIDLDSDDFAKREAAATRLRELGDRAIGFLKEALKARPSLEMRRRVEELLKTLEKPPFGETLRTLRAMAVLEHIGTAEARQVLKTLAQGMPEARITHEAKTALQRLTARHPSEK
ncbi:MAG TPA: WD40 repeat domain-containing protein, partial [Gemmataceae bacterium]|nr:WD40 repeat domain-containing protein [Gemmataceae bacterium]